MNSLSFGFLGGGKIGRHLWCSTRKSTILILIFVVFVCECVCVCVCVCVCKQDCTKTTERILMKFSGYVMIDMRTTWLNFESNLTVHTPSKKIYFCYLWTEFNEIWWAASVCTRGESIKIWLRSDSAYPRHTTFCKFASLSFLILN